MHKNEAMRADFRTLESKLRDLEERVEEVNQNLRFQLETEIKQRENDIKKVGPNKIVFNVKWIGCLEWGVRWR